MGYDTTNKSTVRDKLKDEIAAIEKLPGVEKPTLPEVRLDEIEYAPPTDAELAAAAENALSEEKRKGENAIYASSKNTEKTLGKTRDEYNAALASALEDIGKSYADAARAVDNDVIKRGIARSSVAALQKGSIAAAYADKSGEIKGEYSKKIADVDAEIASIDKKLNEALNDFNLSYAIKLKDKLDALKADREKKIAEVTEFNNKVRAEQAKLDADRKKTESDLYSAAISQDRKTENLDELGTEKRNEIYRAVYDKIDEYLSSLSAADAKSEIRNQAYFREHLSDFYYYKLYDKYGR